MQEANALKRKEQKRMEEQKRMAMRSLEDTTQVPLTNCSLVCFTALFPCLTIVIA